MYNIKVIFYCFIRLKWLNYFRENKKNNAMAIVSIATIIIIKSDYSCPKLNFVKRFKTLFKYRGLYVANSTDFAEMKVMRKLFRAKAE